MRYFFAVGGPRPTVRIQTDPSDRGPRPTVRIQLGSGSSSSSRRCFGRFARFSSWRVPPSRPSPMGAGVVGIDLCARAMGADCVAWARVATVAMRALLLF